MGWGDTPLTSGNTPADIMPILGGNVVYILLYKVRYGIEVFIGSVNMYKYYLERAPYIAIIAGIAGNIGSDGSVCTIRQSGIYIALVVNILLWHTL